jgi:general secretion pathway protein K
VRPARRRQSGVALVLVMFVCVIIAVVAGSFILERRTEHLVVRNSLSVARAEVAANAGVHRALHDLYRQAVPDVWKRDGTPHDWSFEGTPVRVEIRDESAKIDVNTASEVLLRGLLVSVGLADAEATSLLDAMLDWRDADPLKRPNGAEEGDYAAAGLAHRPGNAPFQAIEELQLVLGMRPDIYSRLAPSVTVFSRLPGINTTLAGRDVLLAIPGITAEVVDEYIARREAAREQGASLPILPQAGALNASGSMVATVKSTARLDDGTVFVREAVALLRPVPRRPVTFVAWRESTAAPDALASAQASGATSADGR